MSTDITVVFGDDSLVEEAKRAQLQNRKLQLEKERQALLLSKTGQAGDQTNGAPNRGKRVLRPSAFGRSGGIAMGWLRKTAITTDLPDEDTVRTSVILTSTDREESLSFFYDYKQPRWLRPEPDNHPLEFGYPSGSGLANETGLTADYADNIVSSVDELVLPMDRDRLIYVFYGSYLTLHQTWRIKAPPVTAGYQYDIPFEQQYQYTYARCFLINRSTVRELIMPDGLYTLLRTIYPDWEVQPGTWVDIPANPGAKSWRAPVFKVSNDHIVRSPRDDMASNYGIGLFQPAADFLPDTWRTIQPGGRQYNTDMQGTPGIYYLLRAMEASDPREEWTYLDSAPATAAFLQDAGLTPPDRWYHLCSVDGICNEDQLVYGATDGTVVYNTDPQEFAPEFGTKKRTTGPAPADEGGSNESLLEAWDWNNSSYCIASLLDLGFRAEDLD